MSITRALSLIVEQYHSLPEILDRAVRAVAEEMGMDACSILLIEPRDQRLHLLATHGLDKAALGKVSLAVREGLVGQVVAEMRPLAVEHASSHPGYRYFPETHEERFESFLGVPMAVRGTPIGALVVQTASRRVYSQEEVQQLGAIAVHLGCVVANARLIEALNRGEGAPSSPGPCADALASGPDQVLTGHPASAGIAIGAAVFRGVYELSPEARAAPSRGSDAERARVRDALEKTKNDVLRIQRAAALEADEEHALIFSSHLLLLNDPVLLGRIDQAVAGGTSAPVAVDAALLRFGDQLQGVSDPYIQDRVEDVHDLRSRVVAHLLGIEARAHLRDRVVVSRRIPPSLVVEMKAAGARGLITESGGTTSHGVLLARSMGIPTVTGVSGLTNLLGSDDCLIVDGTQGRVVLNPSQGMLAEYAGEVQRIEEKRSGYAGYRDRPAQTRDGVRVQLQANIGVAADLRAARDNGAEGVGLYRTEFPFILREAFPTREEQVRIYRKAYDFFPQGPINFRILDLGADKFVPGGPVPVSRSPFHGYRSIRVLFDYPHVLHDQVQAFVLAAGERPLQLLIPMVSSLEELRRVKALIAEALGKLGARGERSGPPKLGVMIEIPAAVEIAGELAREADYLSIGTNDLIQYSLVVDREDSRMASPTDPYHPAILRMIRRTVQACHEAGKPVGVCGEMAANRKLAPLLVALGVDALSVVPHAIPEIKHALGTADIGALTRERDNLLALPDARAIDAALKRLS